MYLKRLEINGQKKENKNEGLRYKNIIMYFETK